MSRGGLQTKTPWGSFDPKVILKENIVNAGNSVQLVTGWFLQKIL